MFFQENIDQSKIISLLQLDGTDKKELFNKAEEVKRQAVGKTIYFRGLIEFSNICIKNCYYCGIRHSNNKVLRYDLTDGEIIEAAQYAHEQKYASIVLQSGEIIQRENIKIQERGNTFVLEG